DRFGRARDRDRAQRPGEEVMPAKASRAAFGEALLDLGARDERIVTLDADLSKSTMTVNFAKRYPGRAFNLGIAESNMIGVGAGLALTGRIPFACSFACFIVGRFETIRISVAYTNANLKIVGTHSGIAIGEDGYSQMGIEDIACIRSLPNIGIVQPADELETKQAIAYAVEHQGPLYLRLTRQNLEPVCPPDYRFQYGRWLVLRKGHDVTLIGSGGTVFNCLEAAKRLETDGVSAEVINAACIKPLDEELLVQSAGKTGHVATVEDHAVVGGLGGAVAEFLTEVLPTPIKRLGVNGFGESGDSKVSARVRGGLAVDVLRPEHDAALLGFGIGFTDVVKRASGNAAALDASDFATWAPRLLQKLRRSAPRVACFHGLTAYRPFLALALRVDGRGPALGPQPEVVGTTRLFVVPNPSPANAHFTLADQISWYDRLAEFLAGSESGPAPARR